MKDCWITNNINLIKHICLIYFIKIKYHVPHEITIRLVIVSAKKGILLNNFIKYNRNLKNVFNIALQWTIKKYFSRKTKYLSWGFVFWYVIKMINERLNNFCFLPFEGISFLVLQRIETHSKWSFVFVRRF